MTRRNDPPGTPAKCKSCDRAIVWAQTEKGKMMPVDLAPAHHKQGKFYLFRRADRIEAIHIQSKHDSAYGARQRTDKVYTSHFSTCPNADQHRRGK